MSRGGTVNGYSSYKVADSVTSHEAWGLGIYSYFRDADVKLNSAIEVPDVPGVKIHHATSVVLAGNGEITHVVNEAGASATTTNVRQTLAEYPVISEPESRDTARPHGMGSFRLQNEHGGRIPSPCDRRQRRYEMGDQDSANSGCKSMVPSRPWLGPSIR